MLGLHVFDLKPFNNYDAERTSLFVAPSVLRLSIHVSA